MGHRLVDRDGVLIKIPATPEGLPAIAETLAAGISVNVTLIFSVDRYREVMDAYLTGLEMADAAGIDLGGIHSVASFFISRVDVEVDQRLDAAGAAELPRTAPLAALAPRRALRCAINAPEGMIRVLRASFSTMVTCAVIWMRSLPSGLGASSRPL